MLNTFAGSLVRRLAAALVLALAATGAWAAPIASYYHIDLDTRAYTGTGWLDLQFNPGMLGAAPATASIGNFSGALAGDYEADGAVSGSLPGQVEIGNDSFFNSLFSAITLGGRFSFDLRFAGLANSTVPAGSAFTVALYGADQATPLGDPDPFLGSLLRFELADGGVDLVLSDTRTAGATAVPEPATWMLVLPALLLLGAIRRRRP